MQRVLWLVVLIGVFLVWTSPFHQGLNPMTLTWWSALLGVIATLGCGVVVLFLAADDNNMYLPLVLGLLGLATALAALEPAGTQWLQWLMMALLSLPTVACIAWLFLLSCAVGMEEQAVL